jgi:DNA-binding transcriptional ArsR family regulator
LTNLARDNETETAAGRYEWERVLRRIVMPWELKGFGFLLSTYADSDGSRVRPGVESLTAVTGKSEKTVRRWLKEFRSAGLLKLTARGGGRGGKGKTDTYRLAIPVDLFDRFEVLSTGDRVLRLASVSDVESPVTQVTGQSEESPVIQMTAQSAAEPEMTGHHTDRSIPNENDFHRSNQAPRSRMSGQIRGMTGHPDDRLPPTTPTTQDHPTNPDPAQPPTAQDDQTTDQSEVEVEPAAAPEKCDHGLVRRPRPDGTSNCALCRRQAAAQTPKEEP